MIVPDRFIFCRRCQGYIFEDCVASRPDPERFVAEFSGSSRTVAEYLLAEMLEYQPAEIQQLLLRTSLLDRSTESWRTC